MRKSLKAAPGAAVLIGGVLGLACCPALAADDPPGACASHRHDKVADLLACIERPALMAHLAAFQQIADDHPGKSGHGNRDTGSAGYKASVDYVAALVRQAGYRVTVQPYHYTDFRLVGVPRFSVGQRGYRLQQDWYVARLSGAGRLSAPVQPLGGRRADAAAGSAPSACAAADFAGFVRGRVALVRYGGCGIDLKLAHALAAGAAGLIVYNLPGSAGQDSARGASRSGGAFEAHLQSLASIPVLGVVSYAVGADLQSAYRAGRAPTVDLDIRTWTDPGAVDYNLIADSPYGDPDRVVVLEAHLDSIHGAGILDNASGSATILEIALNLAQTPTRHQLRYIWFGGEEIGLLGSAWYTRNLPKEELRKIVFDIDADVTATPNYAVLIADPANAHNVSRFPPDVVPASERGHRYFRDYFASIGMPVKAAAFGNDGTDSNSFSLAGVPNTGILTQQDCCKSQAKVDLWGGYPGNYEGRVPGHDGGCVDRAFRWCDNLANTNAEVLEFISKSVAYVSFKLANDPALDGPAD